MAKRLLISTLAGGVILFFWGFAWYAASPLYMNSIQKFANAEDVAKVLAAGSDGHGFYRYPSNEEEMATKPIALVIYNPAGAPSMTPFIANGFIGNLIAAGLTSFLLLTVVDPAAGYGKRIAFVTVVYLTAAALCRVPDSIWWHYPLWYLGLELVYLTVGGGLVGAVSAFLTMPVSESASGDTPAT